MLKAKVLAMCVCPAAVAPPAILAFHPPARHAVAHALHNAANHLDNRPTATAAAAAPCLPALAGGVPGDGLLGGGPVGFVPVPAQALAAPAVLPAAITSQPTFASNGAYIGGGGGYVGGYASGGGYVGGETGGGGPGTGAGGGAGPLPPAGGSAVSGAPEPAAWVFLVIGFGLVGAIARWRPVSRLAA